MKITVVLNQQTSTILDINPDESVEKLKAMLEPMLEPMTSTGIQRQQLHYNGKEMNNDDKLSELGVRDGDEITLVSFSDSSSSFRSDSDINTVGLAENTVALQQQQQFDPNLMAQLFQVDPEHAQALSAQDQNELQEILQQRPHEGLEFNFGHAQELALLQADPVGLEVRKKLEAASHQAASGAEENNAAPVGCQSAGEAAPDLQDPLGSPASKSPAANTKGFGLKKWRRLKRDIVKDANPTLDSTAGLKRNFTNNNNAVELNQKSEGSESSTNAVVQKPISGGGESPIIEPANPAYRMADITTFSPGTDSDNSEDRSSKSSTAASVPKFRHDVNKLAGHPREKHKPKHSNQKNTVSSTNPSRERFPLGMGGQVDTSKKPRGEADTIEKENSLSSLESDSRSSNTVSTRGATSYINGASERVSGYNGEHNPTEPSSTRISEENVRSDYNGLSIGVDGRSKNQQTTENKDPLVNCVQMLRFAQDALAKEIQLFSDLGKNMHCLVDDDSVKNFYLSSEDIEQSVTTGLLKAKLIELTQKVQILETQAEEAQINLKEKDSTITEFEQVMTKQKKLEEINAEFESLFRAKIEAEIEYVAVKDSTFVAQNQMKLFAEKMSLDKAQVQAVGNLESKFTTIEGDISGSKEVGRMPKRVALYFCVQLILLIWVGLELFQVRLSPKASMVIPT